MNVHISYKLHKTPDIEREINHHLDKLRKRLQVFRPELIHLKGIIEQNSPREGFMVSLNLRLPSGQLAVQKSASAATAALKAAFEDLVQQLNKHKSQLRSAHKWPRWRRVEKERPRAEVPFEQTLAAVQAPVVSEEDIRAYVNVNLARLERFVERELAYREATDQIPADTVSKEEVIDEAIARALGDGGEKPERLALEPWLYRLALHALGDLSARDADELPAVHLEDSARRQNVRASDEPILQYHQPDETLTGENVIPDRGGVNPEAMAVNDEMVNLVHFALAGVDRTTREVFLLHGIEGFTVEEISAITDRKPSEIESSISAARAHLRRFAPIADRYKERLLQSSAHD
ncbi:MAG TPA: sigma factor-like helix-turn-helix DNA-binding protein [Terriglobales bacterium]|nr:sigma factor-like helix-turn-helix DNA-binding protein [Terriglobales bacterium]